MAPIFLSPHIDIRQDSLETRDTMEDIRNASKETLFETAHYIVGDKTANSGIIDHTLGDKIPRFEMSEMKLGKILGRGGFCMAIEIEQVKIAECSTMSSNSKFFSRFKRQNNSDDLWDQEANQEDEASAGSALQGSKSQRLERAVSALGVGRAWSRNSIAKLAKKRRRKGGRFALKRVCPDLKGTNKVQYLKGIVDIAMEAKFLAALNHPNIIELCGISKHGSSDFIILERLKETLSKRFSKWTQIDRQCKGITGVFTGSTKKADELYEDRITAAHDIACAVDYLHKRNVVFRDLKPDNVGYDLNGILKLFDFGLAKELVPQDRTEDGLYKLTGLTGAIRYMAPEVGLGRPYNEKADVYSWSMIMWFILALEPPFGFYTEDMIRDRVHKRGSRPAIFKSWSEPISLLMKEGWDNDIAMRPSFTTICSTLRAEMLENRSSASGVSGVSALTAPADL